MKLGGRIVLALVVLLVLIVLIVPFFVNANEFRPMLETQLTKSLGRQVHVGNLSLSLFTGSVSADDLSIADDPSFSQAPFLRAQSLKIGVDLWPLIFSHRLNVRALTIQQPQIVLLQKQSGDWNYSTLGASPENAAPSHAGMTEKPAPNRAAKEAPEPAAAPKSAAPPEAEPSPEAAQNFSVSVNLVKVSGGRISQGMLNSRLKPIVLENLNAQLENFSATSEFPFSLSATVVGGGSIELKGKAGPINPAGTEFTPLNAGLKVTELNVAGSGVAQTMPGLAGVISLNATLASNGTDAQLKGRVIAEHLKLAPSGVPANPAVQFDFALDNDLRKHSGTLSQGGILIGKAAASLTGTYAQRGEITQLNMHLTAGSMSVPELGQMLPALGIKLPSGSTLQSGTANMNLNSVGPTTALVTTGTVGLADTVLAGFNLGGKMSTLQTLAGIKSSPDTDVQKFLAQLRAAPDGITVQSLDLVVAGIGEITGSGTISPQNALNFHMLAKMQGSGAVAVLGRAGSGGIPFFITGTTADPQFQPDVKGMASQTLRNLGGNMGNLGNTGSLGKAAQGVLGGLFSKKK